MEKLMNSNSSNISASLSPYLLKLNIDVTYAILFFCAFGTLANIMVFLIIITDKHLRRGTGTLMLQLTAVNLVSCCVVFPVSSYYSLELLQSGRKLPKNACPCIHFFNITTSIMANWYEAILAVNRFVAVLLPLHYSIVKKTVTQAGLVVFCWLTTLIMSVPLASRLTGSYGATAFGFCRTESSNDFSSAMYMINAFGPFLIIAAAALSILCKFSSNKIHNVIDGLSVTPAAGDPGRRRSTIQERRRNMSRMLMGSFLFITLTHAPSYMTATIFPALTAQYPQILTYTRLIALFGSATIPVLFVAMNRDYRRSFKKMVNYLPSVTSGHSMVKAPNNSIAPHTSAIVSDK